MGLQPNAATPTVPPNRTWLRTERIVPVGYAILSALYIVVSGLIVGLLPQAVAQRIEILKGIGFVVVTALLLRSLLTSALQRERDLRESLYARSRALAAADRRAALGLLAASVGHEINNALLVLEANVRVLLEEHGHDDPEIAADVDNALSRLQRHGRQLLELGRPLAPAMACVSLQRVAEDTVRLLQDTGRCKHMRIQIRARREGTVIGDPVGLSQIVMNLVLNAADATNGTGSLWIDVDERDERCLLIVTDDGPGIPEAIRQALFREYVSTKGDRGTGLGLMVSQDIAHRHGGQLICENAERGACFRVELPSAHTRANDAPPSHPRESTMRSKELGQGEVRLGQAAFAEAASQAHPKHQ